MVWIFLSVITMMVAASVSSDFITIGGGTADTVYRNAPTAIQELYAIMSILTLLMITAFMNATANRDISSGMSALVFSSPIRKRDYFFGKFIGAFVIASIPVLGTSLGMLIGPILPWADGNRFGEVFWYAHLHGFLTLGVANTLILGVLVFALAVTFRNTMTSFLGAMMILVVVSISGVVGSNLDKEWIAALIDPFGLTALDQVSRFMSIDEQNTLTAPFSSWFLWNRLLWLGIALSIMGVLYHRFSFTTRERNWFGRKQQGNLSDNEEVLNKPTLRTPTGTFKAAAGNGFSWSVLMGLTRFQTLSVIRNQIFLTILFIGLINLGFNLSFFTDLYGTSVYPTTYAVVDRIIGGFYAFMVAIIIFYTGVLVWKERDAGISDILDASSVGTGTVFLSKFLAMMLALAAIQVVLMVAGILTQFLFGYPQIDLTHYVVELLVMDMLTFAQLVVVALLVHTLVNNRYVGYFIFVAVLIAQASIKGALRSEFNMFILWSKPTRIFSDMNGYGPFVPGMFWYSLYWALLVGLVFILAYTFFVRGHQNRFQERLNEAAQRLRKARIPALLLLTAFLLNGGWIYYNTAILNDYTSSKEREAMQKSYELTYKKYEGMPQPRWVHFDYEIDIFPYERNLFVKASSIVVNKTDVAIDSLHFSLPRSVRPENLQIDLEGARLILDDDRHRYRIYALDQPLMPGDSLSIGIQSKIETRGFENEVSFTSLTQNGTFFNNFDFMPTFGYQAMAEVQSPTRRARLGLPERERMPVLDENDLLSRGNHYVSSDSDWITMRAVVSTAEDQIAVAPGSLKREWTKDGRRYFEYALDHKALNFYAFISARFEVARERWKDVDIEVYYAPRHAMNVPNMLASIRQSLAYYTTHFGPYHHKQARIIQFPRYSSFAQAFPGTMPYSEAIGFISDLSNLKPGDIDPVFYVVAHEMAHQYWAHQVIGARMQGAEMLSETFSQYAALMVMEKAYGRAQMDKFLRHETNSYLRGRGQELIAERPLMQVEQQSYIHYNKGSIVMYYLKEMIGEKNVNLALRSLIDTYGYQEPPYPTSASAVRAFRDVTPDSLQYLIEDLFETMTFYSNTVVSADYTQDGDEYIVTLTTHTEKFRADSLGVLIPVPLNDHIDIGIFARSEQGSRLGKPLLMERVHITQKENTIVRRVASEPHEAGIDPWNYLIDRQPETNTRRVMRR
jgi:ABC-type transport system involved in multi-copper enzyme maturation permease subunit